MLSKPTTLSYLLYDINIFTGSEQENELVSQKNLGTLVFTKWFAVHAPKYPQIPNIQNMENIAFDPSPVI